MNALPVQPAHSLPVCPEEQRWLIDGLWAAEAVGIVGGEPKCCKSFLVLDMAVAVASGRPCLRQFTVATPGRVLLFAAEDALHVVRSRLEGICAAAGVPLESLDVQVITAASLRIDRDDDRHLLTDAILQLKPKLLILDPFVRLHRIDENVSGEVAPILAWLRELQRQHHLAVAVVHHAKKGASRARAGQALRGSSEFHAWGDSNLYIRRNGDGLALSIEHRAAPSQTSLPISLASEGAALALRLSPRRGPDDHRPLSAPDRVLEVLRQSHRPLALTALREACRIKTQTLSSTLADLLQQGRVARTDQGYSLV
jgi:hypothetical protein